ncbi:hypothetical protein DHEL01_v202730 [Diaporthe helianthi]|uniref:Uncharacterized protein n=1 Tax=Diaporthe helianthi TaxID=158607 RepID=A0A2P5I8N7_DIAHE|nr:hypothetical protein DHEL01_v202730 [Diaporthe helianthi]
MASGDTAPSLLPPPPRVLLPWAVQATTSKAVSSRLDWIRARERQRQRDTRPQPNVSVQPPKLRIPPTVHYLPHGEPALVDILHSSCPPLRWSSQPASPACNTISGPPWCARLQAYNTSPARTRQLPCRTPKAKAHRWPVASGVRSPDMAMICTLAIWTSSARPPSCSTIPSAPRSNPQASLRQDKPVRGTEGPTGTLALLAWGTLS